jgi:subtilisin family serine protease
MSWREPSRRRTYALRAALIAGTIVAALFAASAQGIVAAQAADPMDKVEAGVLNDLATGKGVATFWAIMQAKADLASAYGIQDRDARGQFVLDRLTETAEQSQAGLRAFLSSRGVAYEPFWIANTIRITGDEALLTAVAARPDVAKIVASRTYAVPTPDPAKLEAAINVVEWNIDRINADDVWSTFGVRGEGIVVANIDTGVQYNHPALVAQYRGNLGGGSFDHNYNWHDPSMICGSPSLVPCDNNGHGTHTMGTMLGDDGDPGPNQIGVAPHARWIAAKGCETNSCSDFALLSSAQWILAPTDLGGNNPDPTRRPHVVNNSWGGGGGDPWYMASVDGWIASGIFPAFSNGNSGPGCNTSGSPGDYPQSYSAGAFDINNNIAGFSSRGSSAFGGELKPNIAAPGVSVRSSVPVNSYASFNGTSMASPHVAGTVALIWSAAVAIERDIDATKALLDQTAVDTADAQCGGTPADNNVWGEGKLDAFAAVDAAPRGPTGTLTGTVTDASNGNPVAGATIQAVGPTTRTTTTNASGQYSLILPVGTYEVTASAFGYLTETATGVEITDGTTTVQDFALDPAPSHTVSGYVRDSDGQGLEGATVTILGTPIPPATTDANGFYSFASVPEGTYDIRADAGRCNESQTQTLVVDGDETLDFTLPTRFDEFGYFCQLETPAYHEAANPLPLSGDDSFLQITLPFSFTFYGQTHTTAFVCTNGYINFLAGNCFFSNSGIPSTGAPNGAIYPYWDDLFVDGAARMGTELLGSAPNRRFVIEWRNVHYFADSTRRIDVELVLYENGQILHQYRNIDDDGRELGNSATLGIENQTGGVAFQYSLNEPVLNVGETSIRYRIPPSGFVQGTVTDFNDNLPLAGATVKAIQGGVVVRQTTTDGAGFYRMQLRLGTYDIEASKTNYGTETVTVVLDTEDETVTQDFALRTPRGVVSPTSLQFIVPQGEQRTRILTLRNTGSLPMTWEIQEAGGGAAAASLTAGLEEDPSYDPNAATTEGLYKGGTPAGWAPDAPGDVIRSWPPTGLSLAWGVGYTGRVWLSDIPTNNRNHEFTVEGVPTGVSHAAPWAGAWPGDMALMGSEMCQVNVGGDNGIYCWDLGSGAVTRSITGAFPWTAISQRGLAYRPDDDSFYIGGWNEGILYHVAGFSHPTPGQVISQCSPPDGNISGLTWNPAFGIVWEATNSPTDTIYQLHPNTCGVLSTLPHPSPGFAGGGLEMDEAGNLWMIDQSPSTVYLIESGVPAFSDVPWLSESPTSGVLPVNGTQQIQVTVDTTGLAPGVYTATIFIITNSGRQPTLSVPVRLIVPAYYQGVNAGNGPYTDLAGDSWSADQQHAAGSWGYMNAQARVASTRRPISGTEDDGLYQSARVDPTEYRFDGLPAGVYEVDLRFAEIAGGRPGGRLHDVIIEGTLVLPAHDIAGEVGTFAADDHVFFMPVTDGQLNIRLVRRLGQQPPLINGIQVVHRPDR